MTLRGALTVKCSFCIYSPLSRNQHLTMSYAKEIGAHVLLFFLVFGMSATVDVGRMKKQMRNRAALGIGLLLQFVILPFVGFLIVKLLKMPAPMGITLLVITSSPGGSYSNCKSTIVGRRHPSNTNW